MEVLKLATDDTHAHKKSGLSSLHAYSTQIFFKEVFKYERGQTSLDFRTGKKGIYLGMFLKGRSRTRDLEYPSNDKGI